MLPLLIMLHKCNILIAISPSFLTLHNLYAKFKKINSMFALQICSITCAYVSFSPDPNNFTTRKEFLMNYRDHFLDSLTSKSLHLDAGEQLLAEYIRTNYKKVSFLDQVDVSKITSLSPATVVGYVNKLGYNDFEELRKNIRDLAMSELSSTDRFEFSPVNINPQINTIKQAVIDNELCNLTKMLDDLDERVFYTMMEEIIKAPEIIVIGTRSSSVLAIYAEEMFNRLGKKTTRITSGSTNHLNKFPLFKVNAVVLAIGFARYPKETIRTVSFFKKRNFKIISITDHTTSPLTPLSDISLTIPCNSVSITDSYATPFSVINMIIVLLSQIDKEKALSSLNRFEEIAKDYGFYF